MAICGGPIGGHGREEWRFAEDLPAAVLEGNPPSHLLTEKLGADNCPVFVEKLPLMGSLDFTSTPESLLTRMRREGGGGGEPLGLCHLRVRVFAGALVSPLFSVSTSGEWPSIAKFAWAASIIIS